jgi:O-antigen/teichoic acid export membrane protein
MIRNAVLSLGASLAARAASALLFLLLAREAGPAPAGTFSLGTTYLAIFGALLWGLDELAVREVARAPELTGRFFSHLLALRVALSALLLGLLLLVVAAAGYAPATTAFLQLVALSLPADGISAVLQALFVAHRRLGVPFAAGLALFALRLGGGAWALAAGLGLQAIATVWVAGAWLAAGLYLGAALALLRPGRVGLLPLDRAWWLGLLGPALPFVLISALTIVEWQLDVLLLSLLRGEREVGWYSAAMTIFVALWLIPQAYRTALFPEMARRAGPHELELLYTRALQILLALALPIAAGLTLLAPEIVALLYRGDFEPSVPALQVLAWVLVPLFLNVPGVRLLLVRERQGWLAGLVALSLAANVAANLVLIPAWGVLGAAVARALSTGLFYGLHLLALRRYVGDLGLLRAAWRPALATAAMTALVWLLRGQPLALTLAAGAGLYALLGWWLIARPLRAGANPAADP